MTQQQNHETETRLTAVSLAVLQERHRSTAEALARREAQRRDLMTKLVSTDYQIVKLTNDCSDFATAMARIQGLGNKFMPITGVTVERDDPYFPNPLNPEAAAVDAARIAPMPDRDWRAVEAAIQISRAVPVDGDATIYCVTRLGLLDLLRASGMQRTGAVPGHRVETHVDDRDCWLRIGRAIHRKMAGTVGGFELWREISRQSEKFDEQQALLVWKSFGAVPAEDLLVLRSFADAELMRDKTAKREAQQ